MRSNQSVERDREAVRREQMMPAATLREISEAIGLTRAGTDLVLKRALRRAAQVAAEKGLAEKWRDALAELDANRPSAAAPQITKR